MSRIAAIGLGSNLPSAEGDREFNLLAAVERIWTLGRVVAVSSFRDTAPTEFLDQPRFLNGALLLETELDAATLLEALLAVEASMGRDRSGVILKGPRIIDLDLLLFADLIATTANLTVPHPALGTRRFVLEPLAEIAPHMMHPIEGKTVSELFEQLLLSEAEALERAR